MGLHELLLFVVACLAINLIPGPDVIYIISNTMKGSMASGIKAALGLGAGYFVHTLAACVGLSAIIVNSAWLFTVVKWLGAMYLIYLGVQSIRSMLNGNSKLSASMQVSPGQAKTNVFVQGVVVSVLNPKVALFFLSFLPQFVNPQDGAATQQLLLLGCVFCVLASAINLLYASAGSWLFSRPRSQRFTRMLEGVSGGLLLGLAGKVVLTDQ